MSTHLDANQVIQEVYDEPTRRLNVNTNIAVNGDQEIIIDSAHDSIAIGDVAGHLLAVNNDGSINVNVTNSVTNTVDAPLVYNEVTNVAVGIETLIVSYTAPMGKQAFLQLVDMSGTNRAEYRVYINTGIVNKKYTTVTTLSDKLDYRSDYSGFPGFELTAGDVLSIKVIQSGSSGGLGNFNSRVQILEIS